VQDTPEREKVVGVTFSLEEKPDGVSIDDHGVVTISPDIEECSYTIVAASADGFIQKMEVELKDSWTLAASVADGVTYAIPSADEVESVYYGKPDILRNEAFFSMLRRWILYTAAFVTVVYLLLRVRLKVRTKKQHKQ
jgi:hypothetical protein